ncbi:MAG: NADH-quinone oxidoreductase subunit C [Bdellovibrionales bacterium]|nr:NADH-quinone oxidoreductase subunit C [Bdellovibrionales bacterium]
MIGNEDIRTPVPTIYGGMREQFADLWKKQVAELKAKFGGTIEAVKMPGVDLVEVPVIYVKKDQVIEVLKFMKDQEGFRYEFLADLTAVDEESDPRFEVVYNLYAVFTSHSRIRVKCKVREGEEVPTLVNVWPGANWAEREVWDMFGIRFTGHPDLRRILMDERWVGHPLRKDYPLRGYQLFPTPEPIDPKLLD